MEKTTIALIVIAVLIASMIGTTIALFSYVITSHITVVSTQSIIVYKDSFLTVELHDYTWPTINPGTKENMTVYVKNNGNVPVSLILTANLTSYLHLTWNYNGNALQPGASIPILLTMTADSNAPGGSIDFYMRIDAD